MKKGLDHSKPRRPDEGIRFSSCTMDGKPLNSRHFTDPAQGSQRMLKATLEWEPGSGSGWGLSAQPTLDHELSITDFRGSQLPDQVLSPLSGPFLPLSKLGFSSSSFLLSFIYLLLLSIKSRESQPLSTLSLFPKGSFWSGQSRTFPVPPQLTQSANKLVAHQNNFKWSFRFGLN